MMLAAPTHQPTPARASTVRPAAVARISVSPHTVGMVVWLALLVFVVGLACWLSPKLALVGLLAVVFSVVG